MCAVRGSAFGLAMLVLGVAWLPVAAAGPAPSSALEALMFGLEAQGPRPPSPIDDVFDTRRIFATGESGDSETEFEEGSTLNGIALSRRSGVPLGPDDLADRSVERTRTTFFVQGVVPHPDDVFAALTLGIWIDASLLDIPFAETFTVNDREVAFRDLRDGPTLSGIVLAANGVEVDPRSLIDRTDRADRVTAWDSAAFTSVSALGGPSIGRRDVLAAAAITQVDDEIPLVYTPSTADLRHDATRLDEYRVELPEGTAFLGVALAARGLEVDAEDMLSVHERARVTGEDIRRSTYEREDVLFALLLGMRAADQ